MNSGPTDPMIGRTLDQRYVVRSRIARGGMAMVYLGNDLRLGRRVAIKAMHPHLADDENFTRRFEQEARSSAGLGHPNVVNVFDQGEADGVPYLVMEYLPSITLRELLKQQKQLTTDQAVEIAEAVLSGLAAAHDAGFVHRDLKPENVLLADDGRIKIADFGLARAVHANTTTGQALLGTIAYLSPELVTRGIADERSDLYAFGIMLFEMLTGKQPYTGEQPMQIAYQHAHSDVPLPSSLAPEVTPELDQLVRWTTQRDPDARPANAREAYAYLDALRSGGPLAATSLLPPSASSTNVTPSTTVLSSTDQQSLIASVHEPATPMVTQPPHGAAVARARHIGKRRASRGRWVAAVLTLLIGLGAGAGWWWGQGPGSLVEIPSIQGYNMQEAEQVLREATLEVFLDKCSSLTVEQGLPVKTIPAEGQHVARGSTVTLCESTGPRMLEVPTLVGVPLEEAESLIKAAGFTFGEVIERRFGEADAETVILALDSDGNELEATHTEQATINLIVSAGPVPTFSDAPLDEVTTALNNVGLQIDPGLGAETYHDSIAEGRVIRVIVPDGVLRVGDSVGLEISLGPELFAVPDVTGESLTTAMAVLSEAGFRVSHNVPEFLLNNATVTRMNPAAGDMLIAGSTVHLSTRIDLF